MVTTMTRKLLNAGLLATALLAGCVGYNVYPPEKGTGGFSDPNSPPLYQLMTESLKWAVRKYPPGEREAPSATDVPIGTAEAEAAATTKAHGGEPARVAISLFSNLRPSVYKGAVDAIGQGAVPLTPKTETLPRYIVSRVWASGDEAKVDVFRPVTRLGTDPAGAQVYQPITVNLRGGMQYWRVTSYRVWSIGTFTPPPPEYLPGSVPKREAAPKPEPPPAPADTKEKPPVSDGEPKGAPTDPA